MQEMREKGMYDNCNVLPAMAIINAQDCVSS